MEAVFSTPWQHSKLNISSLIKFDPALRQQRGPGNLQRFLQILVIQRFQRPPDGRGTRLWYFEVLGLHCLNQHEANREAKGGTRSRVALGWMHAKPGYQSAAQDEHSHAPARQDCQCRRRSTGRACGDGNRQFWAGGSESPRDEAPIPGDDSARSEGNSPQLPITRAKSL